MTPPAIRTAIRAEVDRVGWTVAELARAAGVTRAQVSNYLSGKQDMTGANLDRILTVLRLEISRGE